MKPAKQSTHTAFSGLFASLPLLLLALVLTFGTAAHAAIVSYQFNGTFTSGTLANRGFSGTYSYDEDSNQIVAFTQSFYDLQTQFTLDDFSSQQTTDFNTFTLSSPFLDIGFEVANSRSNHVKWYDWSVWSVIDYPKVPMNGDTAGIAQIAIVPEPSLIALFGAGLPLLLAHSRRRRAREASV